MPATWFIFFWCPKVIKGNDSLRSPPWEHWKGENYNAAPMQKLVRVLVLDVVVFQLAPKTVCFFFKQLHQKSQQLGLQEMLLKSSSFWKRALNWAVWEQTHSLSHSLASNGFHIPNSTGRVRSWDNGTFRYWYRQQQRYWRRTTTWSARSFCETERSANEGWFVLLIGPICKHPCSFSAVIEDQPWSEAFVCYKWQLFICSIFLVLHLLCCNFQKISININQYISPNLRRYKHGQKHVQTTFWHIFSDFARHRIALWVRTVDLYPCSRQPSSERFPRWRREPSTSFPWWRTYAISHCRCETSFWNGGFCCLGRG